MKEKKLQEGNTDTVLRRNKRDKMNQGKEDISKTKRTKGSKVKKRKR